MSEARSMAIRVRGRVQGVGFRPTVWRLARDLGLAGDVLNDSEGVLIRVAGASAAIETLIERLRAEPPPLARIDGIEAVDIAPLALAGFSVVESRAGAARTEIAPDAMVCAACAAETEDPAARRFRYPFTNCTHCGPRLSIVRGIPYDRAMTTMAPFALCPACQAEYDDPSDRRFHAEAIACPACGPRAWLIRLDERAPPADLPAGLDETAAVAALLRRGEIVAIKGIGGYHLACDATQGPVVAALRGRKRRDAKPFALMARDIGIIRRFAEVGPAEEAALLSPAGPIVLLRASGPARLPEAVAPGLDRIGFMLPTTPLHRLILQRMDRPVVMTSGNLSSEPQVTDEAGLHARLTGIATYALIHDRAIANRVDDSVARVIGGVPRLLRRARGHAPAALPLPPGLGGGAPVLALGAELKATFCLARGEEAILSQHMGDLEDAATFDDWRRGLGLYETLHDHRPRVIAVDRHPDYLSAKYGRARAAETGAALVEVQHHHAHVAACLAGQGRPLTAPPVLGIVADGLGYGDDGAIWGGEFLLADYRGYRRLAALKPVAMPGGAMASREPWRNLYAQLTAAMDWSDFARDFGGLALYDALAAKPRAPFDAIIRDGRFAPRASSCGRLFDAVAAALDLCRERQSYEGQAAMMLEALADGGEAGAYPFDLARRDGDGLPLIEPRPMWRALLGDLSLAVAPSQVAARFHRGLARAMVAMAVQLRGEGAPLFDTVALSGGCFQNAVLFEAVERGLADAGFTVLSHAEVPANDGGIAIGQAAIALATTAGAGPCA
ncbi:carbamoyltransferase HypF [Zavarzinia aquatilis]|uniref:Carbamoyltransferase HypF n=1 Tax=Zavarzinia aquatilis TaxID=2211142 RepID=A0A317E739_9PROT|nr:carbamoyltransferase HypF [Zavarzinia aquatilis]PWR22857.1 carbamoyltransferase HypF [Zavarzinia aquatilis]